MCLDKIFSHVKKICLTFIVRPQNSWRNEELLNPMKFVALCLGKFWVWLIACVLLLRVCMPPFVFCWRLCIHLALQPQVLNDDVHNMVETYGLADLHLPKRCRDLLLPHQPLGPGSPPLHSDLAGYCHTDTCSYSSTGAFDSSEVTSKSVHGKYFTRGRLWRTSTQGNEGFGWSSCMAHGHVLLEGIWLHGSTCCAPRPRIAQREGGWEAG